MKAYVITIMDNIRSVQIAGRCIRSAAKYDLDVTMWPAITPKNKPAELMKLEGIDPEGFKEVYSRHENCMAAFMSHYSLWNESVNTDENILILEHDAVIKDYIPEVANLGCISLGKPSYGKYNTPTSIGAGPLVSKPYFPGAHAYMITPYGASRLIKQAKIKAGPTDVFLHRDTFPFLQEYYPWPVEVNDTFTTIQNQRGCLAKHNYGETYEIL